MRNLLIAVLLAMAGSAQAKVWDGGSEPWRCCRYNVGDIEYKLNRIAATGRFVVLMKHEIRTQKPTEVFRWFWTLPYGQEKVVDTNSALQILDQKHLYWEEERRIVTYDLETIRRDSRGIPPSLGAVDGLFRQQAALNRYLRAIDLILSDIGSDRESGQEAWAGFLNRKFKLFQRLARYGRQS